MTEDSVNMGLEGEMAVPLHLQRLERSLNIQPFLNQVNHLFQDHLSDDGKSVSSDSSDESNSYPNNVLNQKEEERINNLRLYNMNCVGDERRWLQDILLSDSSDSSQSGSDTEGPITEDDFQDMLKFHILRKKYQGRFYQKPENIQYQYYGAGLLSTSDRFPEHQKLIVGNKKRKEKKSEKKTIKVKKEKTTRHYNTSDMCQGHDYPAEEWDKMMPKEEMDESELESMMRHQPKARGRKKHNAKTPEMMALKRRKIWIMMSKKELGKVQRAKTNNHKEMLISCKKVAQHCMKYWRQKAMQSQKNMKETIWRAKRLTREMQSYWKRYDRVERETRRRLEKEAEEQRKMDVELIEFATEYIHRSLHGQTATDYFSFLRLIGVSPMELNHIFICGILYALCHATIMEKKMRIKRYWEDWGVDEPVPSLIIVKKCDKLLDTHPHLFFTKKIFQGEAIYTHTSHTIHSIAETMAHRILRSSKHSSNSTLKFPRSHGVIKPALGDEPKLILLPEHRHHPKPPIIRTNQLTSVPAFLCDNNPKVQACPRKLYVSNSSAACAWRQHEECGGAFGQRVLRIGCEPALISSSEIEPLIGVPDLKTATMFSYEPPGGLAACAPINGWSNIIIPDKQTLVTDAGKLSVLDSLLKRLKEQGHRVLIYSQMTKMIDLLEEYMYHRKHTFMRLDGSSKIADRRDMVADFQKRADIFVFLLSTRAGGLGINLTAADTVIFYDSDWNPTVDQQAMDRAHRLGQTKQVTVYRLICKGTIEERILQRAREKSEIQRMVISGGNFKPDTLKPKEVVSLLLDDEEIEAKYSQRSEERKQHITLEDTRMDSSIQYKEKERKRKLTAVPVKVDIKRPCLEDNAVEKLNEVSPIISTGEQTSPTQQNNDQQTVESNEDYGVPVSPIKSEDETSNEGLVVDVDGPIHGANSPRHVRGISFNEPPKVSKLGHHFNFGNVPRVRTAIRGTSKRGRPRGSRRGGPVGGKGRGMLLQHPLGSLPNSPGSSQFLASSSTSDRISHHGAYSNVGSAEGDGPSTVGPLGNQLTSGRGLPVVRRGPGRPRLRPAGPGNQGYRSQHYGKRIQRPLPVPLRSHQLVSSVQSNPTNPTANQIQGVITEQSGPSASFTSESRPFGFYTQQAKNQMQ
ncbi:putative DNA helicase Ino80 [Fopius arisanus]|uniref:Chromatin-remodeling ATPase INO80 n=1 Tax=Fopius arisanus TaxID=64838 RepID=A0A9R1TCB4_9HYME|nr:PREDICTED: putative DNA helicase Ino80 [Fopius arisanus]